MSYTKGPWKAAISNENKLWICSNKKPICTVPITRNPGETSEKNAPQALANARLIAAAPELLEALESFVNSMDLYRACGQVYPPKVETLMIKARQAIAKAKGQP